MTGHGQAGGETEVGSSGAPLALACAAPPAAMLASTPPANDDGCVRLPGVF